MNHDEFTDKKRAHRESMKIESKIYTVLIESDA